MSPSLLYNVIFAVLVLICFVADLSFFYPDAAPEVVEKPGDSSLSKLKALYIQAKELSESEVRYEDSFYSFYELDNFHFIFFFPIIFMLLW